MQTRKSKKMTMSATSDVKFCDAYKMFVISRKAKNLSEDTIKYYDKCYNSFVGFLGEDKNCSEICKNDILQYILYLNERDIKDVTVNNYLRGVRAIVYYFMEERYTDEFPIQLIKVDSTVKETYTDAELERLLKKPNVSQCSFSEYRNWVIVCFAYGTASRSATIRNIKIEDIDFYNNEIRYTKTKGRKQYIIPLSDSLHQILQEYLQFRKGKEQDFLFCTIYGEPLSRDALTNTIRHYNTSRGVSKTSMHLFRHTFAKHWILNGGDIFRLQKILGHSTLDMVKQYVNMFSDDLKNGFDDFSPFEQMKGHILPKDSIKIKKR